MNPKKQPTEPSADAGDPATSEDHPEALGRCPVCERIYHFDALAVHTALHDDNAIIAWAWNITSGRADHSEDHPEALGFLKGLAGAILRADGPNFAILKPVALQMIHKYPEYLNIKVGDKARRG